MTDVTPILSLIEQGDAQASYVDAYEWYVTGI